MLVKSLDRFWSEPTVWTVYRCSLILRLIIRRAVNPKPLCYSLAEFLRRREMPSKGKKNQKYSSSPSRSPRTPSTPLSASSAGDDSLHHRHLLSALCSAHPSLLPSASSAFSGTIVESETSLSKGNRAVVYLSETAVVSSAFHPGSLVSVLFYCSCTISCCLCNNVWKL